MESLSRSGVMSDSPSRHSTDARYPSIDGTRCCRFSTSLGVAHSVGVTEAMVSIDDGRWGWDGIRTISLHCEMHILWEIPRGPSDLGVESEWGPPSPIHQPTMGASISAIDHPLADWITEGQLPGLLRHSPHQPIDDECSSRQVGDVSGSTTRTPSQCSFPSTAKACYYRAPYEATLAAVAHGLASTDFHQLFCTLYRHVSLNRITSPQTIPAPPAQR